MLVISGALFPVTASAACKLDKMAELPVTMIDSRPLITAKVNGEDVRFVADSGAFFSMISSAGAAELKLRLSPAAYGLRVVGMGGSAEAWVTTVKIFTLAGIPLRNVEFLVGGSEVGGGSVGVLGQNVFRAGDVEYDLAKGVIRLMHAEDCGHTVLAYWAHGEQSYSVMDIGWTTPMSPHTMGMADINGARIRVMFDTGAAASILSLKAAERAGVKPGMPGIVDGGNFYGIGRATVKTYIAPFASFKIGDEEVRNTRLRIGDVGLDDADMLIGVDFFLSHRIYVASSQHRLYFTYNGGPVFNLARSPAAPPATPPDATPATKAPAEPDRPADAAVFSRSGTAFAARRDFEHALADLTRACELDPGNSEYRYQRGVVYRENGQPAQALADFDRSLELKPDHLPARVARAEMRLRAGDIPGAGADLDSAARIAPKEDDVRYFLGRDYERADLPAPAIAQFDLWILAHPDDAKMAGALNGRCWARAVQGENLALGLSDCNAALKLSTKASAFHADVLDSRGLVRLRLGDYDKAIADYDASLKIDPRSARALYGRGVAESRKKQIGESEADIAAAAALVPRIGDDFKRHGVTP